MIYAIIGTDVPNSASKRAEARQAHLARIEELHHQGRLLTAGPMPQADAPDRLDLGVTGSLIVAEFSSIEQARLWAEQDPYVTQGVFAEVRVTPYVQVLPPTGQH